MKILQVHNFYQQRGGEDAVVSAECELLRSHGHEVIQYTKHNNEVEQISPVRLLAKTIFNTDTEEDIRDLLKRESPIVIHSHNTFPLISPAIYYAAARSHIPVVQTLHNFRLICPSAILLRDGKICEDCVGRVPYSAIVHACYRGNRGASAATASMITAHRLLGTWQDRVNTYIALTAFARDKFIEGGLPGNKIVIKPNFLAEEPGIGDGTGNYALFASRLSKEKGLGVLLDAWGRLRLPIPLKIAGSGDLKAWVQERASGLEGVEVLGQCSRSETLDLMKRASLVVVPSECYEGLPMTIVEAFACGTPVVTSKLPSMDELVTDRVNGARFECGSGEDLARRIEELWRSPSLRSDMRKAARVTYESCYTPERNYRSLMKIYEHALASIDSPGDNVLVPEKVLDSAD